MPEHRPRFLLPLLQLRRGATQVVPGSTVDVTWPYKGSTTKAQLLRDPALRIASELKQYCGTASCPTD